MTGLDPLDICRRQAPINDCVARLDPPVDNGEANDDGPAAPPKDSLAAPKDDPEAVLPTLIARLTDPIQPPESPLIVGLPPSAVRPKWGDIQANVDDLSLRGGPADVPAVHDFSHLTIAFGCTGGQHRSVLIAEEVKKTLSKSGFRVKVQHRDSPR